MKSSETKKMKQEAPILIMSASSQPYLSLGRHFGGVKAYGFEYVYLNVHDVFLRKDYQKEYNKQVIKEKKTFETFVEYLKNIK